MRFCPGKFTLTEQRESSLNVEPGPPADHTAVRPGLYNTITLVKPPPNAGATSTDRWTRLLAAPRTIMVLVPLLVLVLGVTLTVIGQLALSATSKTMAKERFVEQTASSTLRVESALAQADPLLAELDTLARGFAEQRLTLAAMATQMHDLLVARKGISQAYIAFEDGRFWGVGPGPEGQLEFQESSPRSASDYTISPSSWVNKSLRRSTFDPRRRAWYVQAKETAQPVWSKPYVFYFNHHPGVTRAVPLFKDREHKELLGVVGVDFDVEALTAFMAAGESGKEGARSVVFSPEGVVLAYPFGARQIAALPNDHEVITHHALQDYELSALVQAVLALPSKKRNVELMRLVARQKSRGASTKMLASVKTLGAGGPEWYVASFAAESTILHELHNHRARSLWIGGCALLLAVAMGWWLSKYILRVKGQVAVAQADAQRARKQVRDLGSYQLLSLLGEGGMGEVWRARHLLLARQSAIKLIKLGSTVGQHREDQRERFRREAQAIAGLRSRNTVALYDYGVTPDGTLFYVMELLDGIDLSRLVARHRAQPPDRVRQILIQVCNSLSEAHDAQLIHRDIKPANLFLCREANEVDIVKVLDFGLVFHAQSIEHAETLPGIAESAPPVSQPNADPREVSAVTERASSARITHPEHQVGTPAFMSPEQAAGPSIDHRSDLYSLGCVAWWLLTGSPPFKADSQRGYMIEHLHGNLPHLATLATSISPEFAQIILSCLSRDPAGRPHSARDLADVLRRTFAGGEEWTRQKAEQWWQVHRPRERRFSPNYTVGPLHDAELLGPTLRQG
jgi:serine/threonine protein kinase